MVRVRQGNFNTRRNILRRVRRNRQTRRTFFPIITLENEIIAPVPEIIDLEPQSPIPIITIEEESHEIIPVPHNQYSPSNLVERITEDRSNCSTISLNSDQASIPGPSVDWSQSPETASISGTFQHLDTVPLYNYYPEENSLYSPPSYSPVAYEDPDPFEPLEISLASPERPISTINIEYSYFLPELYGYPREE